MKKPYYFKVAVYTLLFGVAALSVKAQKLKEVQEYPVPAPEQVRVDGKDKEWKDSFSAHNKRTDLFYTVCNDQKNLYVVIKSDKFLNNTKILAGGITFSVNPDGKKKEEESLSLTYPLITRNGRGAWGGGGRGPGGGNGARGAGNRGERGSQPSPAQRDSANAAAQKVQLAQVKEIKVKGFKNITDTLISIYNEYGIKAAGTINQDNLFFCEIAIPLEQLGIAYGAGKEFAYHIRVNGLDMANFGGGRNSRPGGGGGNIDMLALASPTDFWGKYTLSSNRSSK